MYFQNILVFLSFKQRKNMGDAFFSITDFCIMQSFHTYTTWRSWTEMYFQSFKLTSTARTILSTFYKSPFLLLSF